MREMRVGLMPDSAPWRRPASPEAPRRSIDRVARPVEDEVAGVEVAVAMVVVVVMVMVLVVGWRSR